MVEDFALPQGFVAGRCRIVARKHPRELGRSPMKCFLRAWDTFAGGFVCTWVERKPATRSPDRSKIGAAHRKSAIESTPYTAVRAAGEPQSHLTAHHPGQLSSMIRPCKPDSCQVLFHVSFLSHIGDRRIIVVRAPRQMLMLGVLRLPDSHPLDRQDDETGTAEHSRLLSWDPSPSARWQVW